MPKHSEEKKLSSKHKNKKSKKKKRRSSSSSSSSNSSDEPTSSMALIKSLEEKREKLSNEKKKMKELLKATETAEEKRARRLREKMEKEARRRQRMGWDKEYQQYTDQDNPFGDSNLTSTFVWKKKLEKDGLKNASMKAVEIISKQKQVENKIELEKVKKRRLEREMEKQMREEETLKQQRVREAAQFEEWEKQEDLFHFEQAKLRSTLRIQDGRAKPIDLLAQYISGRNLEEGIEMQMHEPYVLLNGLSMEDLEDLLEDIKIFRELEKGNNSDFWSDMTLIVEDEIQKLAKLRAESNSIGRREGINHSVVKEVSEIFRGKDAKQLEDLRLRIERKIKSRSEGIDISYWESLLLQLKAHLAKARLRDKHHEILTSKLELLKNIPAEGQNEELSSMNPSGDFSPNEDNNDEESDTNSVTEDMILISLNSYVEGNYSPKYYEAQSLKDLTIRNESDDEDELAEKRQRCLDKVKNLDYFTAEELKLRNEARSDMTGDEAEFSVEATISNAVQVSSDKYRPRKPRYFNRVHTGFEWNKYNQTHYDMDNPPPKIVQGYKFNIFYPDLIDKNTTPQYFLNACKENPDFAILRFHSGPPYEDIAFKIVNREWEFSYKRGFRCQFHNNIFQLWFHFKRYRYRR